MPPIIAILLALFTKEVYLSLFAGCALGALLVAEFHPWVAFDTLFNTMINSVDFSILMFMILLGMVVMLMQESGGTRAYGEWAAKKLKSKRATLVATSLLGALIFVDDYFNCLTVGSVMRPVTDKYKVSRAKLAYLIDATAAPVCIIAPVSSWAAAVTSSVPEGSGINGFTMFLRTIPYNYYALLTLVMIFFLVLTGADYGPMKLNEDNALNGDLFTTEDRPYGDDVDDGTDTRGHVIDLILPVVVLIAACIFGLIYTGGFFSGVDFITAFSDCNASAGLVMGSSIALLFTFVFYRVREVMTFQDFAACIPEGFKAIRMLAAEGIAFDEEGRVLMEEFQWDGRPESAGAPGNAHVTGDSGAADTADATDYPTAPPPDFDWEAELAEHPLHHCETCAAPRPDCKKERHA